MHSRFISRREIDDRIYEVLTPWQLSRSPQRTAVPYFTTRGSDDRRILTMLDRRRMAVSSTPAAPPKSPVLAALLSFLLVGMGQIYLGQVEKGLCMLAVVLLLVMTVVLGPIGIVILLINVVDAFVIGMRMRDGKQIGKWQFFFSQR
jgi:TM2 domain-containing membrane protein YozV